MSARTTTARIADLATVVIALATLAVLGRKYWPTEAARPSLDLARTLSDVELADARSEGRRVGPANAKVSVVVFSDYQCPYCLEADRTLREIVRDQQPNVVVVMRHLPLTAIHPRALLAASAADCAGEQGQFATFHAALFDRQAELTLSDTAWYMRLADTVKITDRAAFRACLGSAASLARIHTDSAVAGRLGIAGTPALVVGDQMLLGSPAKDDLAAALRHLVARSN